MRPIPPGNAVVSFFCLVALTGACASSEADPQEAPSEVSGGNAQTAEVEIAQRVSNYLEVLTVHRDADLAGEFYTEDARLVGPGMDMDRPTLIEGMRGTPLCQYE